MNFLKSGKSYDCNASSKVKRESRCSREKYASDSRLSFGMVSDANEVDCHEIDRVYLSADDLKSIQIVADNDVNTLNFQNIWLITQP